MCLRYFALTSSGDSLGTSGGAAHGNSGAVRSTPGWHSHDLALVTCRPGTLAPWLRANTPTVSVGFFFHGKSIEPGARSCGPGRYRNDGNSGRSCTCPAATTCGTLNVCSFGPPTGLDAVST